MNFKNSVNFIGTPTFVDGRVFRPGDVYLDQKTNLMMIYDGSRWLQMASMPTLDDSGKIPNSRLPKFTGEYKCTHCAGVYLAEKHTNCPNCAAPRLVTLQDLKKDENVATKRWADQIAIHSFGAGGSGGAGSGGAYYPGSGGGGGGYCRISCGGNG
jgi:hypothetical protein